LRSEIASGSAFLLPTSSSRHEQPSFTNTTYGHGTEVIVTQAQEGPPKIRAQSLYVAPLGSIRTLPASLELHMLHSDGSVAARHSTRMAATPRVGVENCWLTVTCRCIVQTVEAQGTSWLLLVSLLWLCTFGSVSECFTSLAGARRPFPRLMVLP
jgi:hypothetical protein